MDVFIGIILAVLLGIFLFYGLISIRHAARFRYLGPRTVYLTLFFVAGSTMLFLFALAFYIGILVN